MHEYARFFLNVPKEETYFSNFQDSFQYRHAIFIFYISFRICCSNNCIHLIGWWYFVVSDENDSVIFSRVTVIWQAHAPPPSYFVRLDHTSAEDDHYLRKRARMRRWLCCSCQVEESYPSNENEPFRSPKNHMDGTFLLLHSVANIVSKLLWLFSFLKLSRNCPMSSLRWPSVKHICVAFTGPVDKF